MVLLIGRPHAPKSQSRQNDERATTLPNSRVEDTSVMIVFLRTKTRAISLRLWRFAKRDCQNFWKQSRLFSF